MFVSKWLSVICQINVFFFSSFYGCFCINSMTHSLKESFRFRFRQDIIRYWLISQQLLIANWNITFGLTLSFTTHTVPKRWGPGIFDAEHLLDLYTFPWTKKLALVRHQMTNIDKHYMCDAQKKVQIPKI